MADSCRRRIASARRLAPLVAAVAAALLAGCAGPQPAQAPRAALDSPMGVAPLTEAEFEGFASRVAGRLSALLRERGLPAETPIAGPVVAPLPAEPPEIATSFAWTLGDGLNDRLASAARFVPAHRGGAFGLRATVAFTDAATEQRRVSLVIADADGRELLRDEHDYLIRPAVDSTAAAPVATPEPKAEPAPKRRADGAARPPDRAATRRPRLTLGMRGEDFGRRAAEEARQRTERSIAGDQGAVLFLNEHAWENFQLAGQRATRLPDGRLRAEMDFRARGRKRDAELRVAFLDDAGEAVEVTPRLSYEFRDDYTTTVVISAAGQRPSRYVCVIED